jgi:hypothetical protein
MRVNPLILLAVLALLGCPPGPPVAPPVDASDGGITLSDASADVSVVVFDDAKRTPEDLACIAMQRVGCIVLADCAATIRKIDADPKHFNPINVSCLEEVQTVSDVSKCGASCGRVP